MLFSGGRLRLLSDIAIVIGWLLLLTVSQEYVKAGAPDASHFQTLGTLLQKATTVQLGCIMDIVFPLGALMLYFVFYQSKLIPRWISVWGLVGAIIYLASGMLVMFGSITSIDRRRFTAPHIFARNSFSSLADR